MVSLYLKKRFELSSISKYRTELMGIAILGVMLGHITNLIYHPKILEQFLRLVHTFGFIFLSGFGLYFSFSKSPFLSNFYVKRIKRVYFPYLIISSGFFILFYIFGKCSFLQILEYLTTLAFWYEGNYYGMWYIAISLFLYLIFPLLYRLLFGNCAISPGKRTLIVMMVTLLLLISIQYFFPEYWNMLQLGLPKILIFPLGVYCGYLAKKESPFLINSLSVL